MEQIRFRLVATLHSGPALGRVDLSKTLEAHGEGTYALAADADCDVEIERVYCGPGAGSPTMYAGRIERGAIEAVKPVYREHHNELRYRAAPGSAGGELRLYRPLSNAEILADYGPTATPGVRK